MMRVGAFLTLLLVLLIGGAFGVWHAPSVDGQMSGCPFMAHAASLCGMGPSEHIALWERLFTAAPHRAFLLLLSVLLLSAALFRLRSLRVRTWVSPVQYQAYRRLALAFAPLDPLEQAFSQGILHPKICG